MNILNKKAGFTLMEIMVAVLVIGILAVAGVPYYHDHLERQKAALGITNIRMIADSVERYMVLHPSAVPTTFDLLDIDLDITGSTYNDGNFTFTIENQDPGYVQGQRNTGEYTLRFILGDEPKLCCNSSNNICTDKLNLTSCQ